MRENVLSQETNSISQAPPCSELCVPTLLLGKHPQAIGSKYRQPLAPDYSFEDDQLDLFSSTSLLSKFWPWICQAEEERGHVMWLGSKFRFLDYLQQIHCLMSKDDQEMLGKPKEL